VEIDWREEKQSIMCCSFNVKEVKQIGEISRSRRQDFYKNRRQRVENEELAKH
jgi:hypothetical protein